MNLGQIEPFALLTLAGGLLYSICILIFECNNFKLHFIVLTLVIFIALLTLSTFKYIQCCYRCPQINDLIMSMKIK